MDNQFIDSTVSLFKDKNSEINPYLKATDDKDGNSLNRVLELVESEEGQAKLLKYCALLGALHTSCFSADI